MDAPNFERLIHKLLDFEIPFGVLPNVLLFRPEDADQKDYGYEIDNIFHYQSQGIDYIVVVEVKNQPIQKIKDEWIAIYSTGKKDVSQQVVKHANTILSYLRPLSKNTELRIECIVVSSDENTVKAEKKIDGERIKLCLMGYQTLLKYIESLKNITTGIQCNILRISQSEFLSLLRLGIPAESLGHPELKNAINYINRCRRYIDAQLFRTFIPSHTRWAINGTAGMGKSVLLAYATCVFASDQEISDIDGKRRIISWTKAEIKNLPSHLERNIFVYSMKPKQKQVLELLYQQFVQEFSDLANQGHLKLLKPTFSVWDDTEEFPESCNILIIDEAHDLTPIAQIKISKWHSQNENRYLLVACDRHQKLKLVGDKAPIIEGVKFSGFTKKLNCNYRNPFPVYAASMALMFRWFSESGPKILPSPKDLRDGLGFNIQEIQQSGQVRLEMRSDAHPANCWSHCLESFPSCAGVFSQLNQLEMRKTDVLWVRFSKENADFDYEQLSCFTYHNFNTEESSDLVDKYIKGQEFPIVVVEGFPDAMDDWGTESSDDINQMSTEERKMWRFRRQLYMCCSRATAFLYFVCDSAGTSFMKRIEKEINLMVSSLSLPWDRHAAGGKMWRFNFNVSEKNKTRFLDVFTDDLAVSEDPLSANTICDIKVPVATAPTEEQDPIKVPPQITVKMFAAILGVKPYKIVHYLSELNCFMDMNSPIPNDVFAQLAKKLEINFRIENNS